MPLANHLDALAAKHEFLEHLIREESLRPCPDFVVLTDLKKNKLQLKQEMHRLNRLAPHAETASG